VITARLADATSATPRTRRLRLQFLEGRLAFAAGQAVFVGIAGSGQRAAYSIASAPALAAAGALELLVPADGAFGQLALDPLAVVGAILEVEGPVGTLGVPADAEVAPLLLVAGGTGIAPIRSVVLDRLERTHAAPMSLVYSARGIDEFAFGDELEALHRAGRLTLHCTVTRDDASVWPGRTGRVDEEGWAFSLASMDEMGRVGQIEKAGGFSTEWQALSELKSTSPEPLKPPMQTVQILGGRKEKIRAGDVLGALTKDLGFAGAQIGKINVNEFSTYVAVEREIAQQVVRKLSAGKVKGRGVKLRLLES